MPDIALFSPNVEGMSSETREVVAEVNRNLMRLRREYLASVSVTWDMPEKLMLEILQARLFIDKEYYRKMSDAGCPSSGLGSYVDQVIHGYALRVNPRVREALLLIDQGIQPSGLPRGHATYHPGEPPPHKRWRAARAAKADAAARAAPWADAAGASA